MKKTITRVAIILLWIALCAAGDVRESPIRSSPYFPQSSFIVEREGYVVAYDGRTRSAYWVYEKLSRDSFEIKNTDRSKFRFKADESIPAPIRASPQDYQGSGFDLGHLCPYADCRSHEAAAAETFFLSNISPQVPQFNRGYWLKLEAYLRNLALEYKVLHIITIPLYLPQDGFVRYQVIGQNSVAVPTHFCKVVFAEKSEGVDVLAYILPNAKISNEESLDQFRSTVEKVEHLSGVIFPGYVNPHP
jgi:endonuclease G, mitochondrial